MSDGDWDDWEDNEFKMGKFLPKTGIPIVGFDQIDFEKPALIVILAWNFSDDIIKKIKRLFRVPIKVIIPLPELKILNL